jgi:hypothetical protein
MPNPFITIRGNQRVVAIPVTPTAHAAGFVNAAGTVTQSGPITLGSNSIATFCQVYLYYLFVSPDSSGAASAITIGWQFQFQDAAHAAVGGPTAAIILSTVGSGAGTGIISNFAAAPAVPMHYGLAVPATAVEIVLQSNAFGVLGAPVARWALGWGVDVLNAHSTTGDIGGAGLVAQNALDPNTF